MSADTPTSVDSLKIDIDWTLELPVMAAQKALASAEGKWGAHYAVRKVRDPMSESLSAEEEAALIELEHAQNALISAAGEAAAQKMRDAILNRPEIADFAHEVRSVISRVVGCKSVPACQKHREIVDAMFLALSGRFTFVAIPGDNTIDTADVAPIDKELPPEDQRTQWGAAVRRAQRRLRGLVVLASIERDIQLLEGIARSLEDVFGVRP